MKKYITQRQFINYLKYTPYFIWNNLNDLQHNNNLNEVEDSFSWIRFDQEDLMKMDFNYENTFSLKDTKATRIIQIAIDSYLSKNWKNIYFIKSKNIDDAIMETLRIIKEAKYSFIVNPIFKYKDAIARIKGYDIKNSCIYSQKFSVATKKKDWCDIFWNYKIASKSTKILDIKLIILSSGPNRKGELSFLITTTANYQASCPAYKYQRIEEGGFSRYSNDVLANKNKIKSGEWVSNIYKKRTFTTFNSVFINRKPSKIGKHHIANSLMIMNIDSIIKKINEARKIHIYKHNIKDEMLNINNSILSNDNTKQLLSYFKHETHSISGTLMPKKRIATLILNDDETYRKDGILKDIFNKRNIIDKKRVLEIISSINNPNNRIVWYDFEGYSLPTATLDYFPPFQQTIFQVSIIETKNKIIQNKINKVYDPKILSAKSFINIINDIYSLQAEVYVVYNKNYENTRIKEMVDWLEYTNHPFASQEAEKAKWIMERTIDLADLFATRSKNIYPPILLHELQGMYSIKLLEKYITKNNIQLPTLIKEYSKLKIQDGLMAMNVAIERSLNIIGDKEWIERQVALKIYCENDVKAMMMVYDLANYLINDFKI